MPLLLIIIVLIVLLGGGGYGFHRWGPVGGGISMGTILIVLLLLYLLGVLG